MNPGQWQDAFEKLKFRQETDCFDFNDPEVNRIFDEWLQVEKMREVTIEQSRLFRIAHECNAAGYPINIPGRMS